MLKVYKTKNLKEEIGKACVVKNGFEVVFHNGGKKYLIYLGKSLTGSFNITSKNLAVFLGEVTELSIKDEIVIAFNTDEKENKAFLHIDQDYYLIEELESTGGLAA